MWSKAATVQAAHESLGESEYKSNRCFSQLWNKKGGWLGHGSKGIYLLYPYHKTPWHHNQSNP